MFFNCKKLPLLKVPKGFGFQKPIRFEYGYYDFVLIYNDYIVYTRPSDSKYLLLEYQTAVGSILLPRMVQHGDVIIAERLLTMYEDPMPERICQNIYNICDEIECLSCSLRNEDYEKQLRNTSYLTKKYVDIFSDISEFCLEEFDTWIELDINSDNFGARIPKKNIYEIVWFDPFFCCDEKNLEERKE